jgi:hypothetical protein
MLEAQPFPISSRTLKLHGLDQRNRSATKPALLALMKFPKKAFICCNAPKEILIALESIKKL